MARESLLTTDNYIEILNSLTVSEWKPLFDLIPLIEKEKEFGKMEGCEKIEEGVFSMPYMDSHKIVDTFLNVVYDIPIIIDFNWVSWQDGRSILNDEYFDFDSIDIPAKCKLITAIVRNDRFCEGALVSAFESGIMLKILKSVMKEIGKTI